MRKLIALVLTATLTLAAVAPVFPQSSASVTPNSPYQEGVNAAVSIGASSPAEVAAKAQADSGKSVTAIWFLTSGQWAYYLPAFPSASSLTSLPNVASIFIVLAGSEAAPQPTAAPTAAPTQQPTVAPTATATPASARTGAVCNDGTSTTATGGGACSGHGGVAYWLY